MSLPLVSIVTPTFNHERFIGPCIESVLKQSYRNWEQIVIDDGSTDKTAQIVRNFADSRIQYIYQENQGIEALAHTYNRALAEAKGEFIAVLEGDDLWPANKLSSLIPALAKGDRVLAFGGVADVSADGSWSGRVSRAVRQRRKLPKHILFNDPVGSATRYMLRADGADLIPPSTVVIRKSVLDDIGGFQFFPDLCVTDFPTFLSLTLKGRFYYTLEIMGYRRRHRRSATYGNQRQIADGARAYARNFLQKNNVELTVEEGQIIERSWQASRCDGEFTAGRLCLIDGRWREGRSHFRSAFEPSLPRLSVAASIGWLLSWVHCDLERFLALAGFASLRES